MSLYSLLQAVGRPEAHMGDVRVGQHFGAAILSDVFRVVADQAVSLAGDTMLDLAGGGEFEALLHTALGLELGHFRLLVSLARGAEPLADDCGRTRQPLLAGPSL